MERNGGRGNQEKDPEVFDLKDLFVLSRLINTVFLPFPTVGLQSKRELIMFVYSFVSTVLLKLYKIMSINKIIKG